MVNRLLFSIRYFSKVFQKYLQVVLSLVVFLTIIRFNVFFLSVSSWLKVSSLGDVLFAFFTGMRFDLLVYGYLLAPALLFWYLVTFTVQWNGFTQFLSKAWFQLTWFAIAFIQVVDFIKFNAYGERLRQSDNQGHWLAWLQSDQIGWGAFVVFIIVVAVIWLLGVWMLNQVELGHWKDEYSPIRGGWFELLWRLSIPLVIVIFMARGTFEEVPLSYMHSLINDDTRLNEMSLNPMWSLFK